MKAKEILSVIGAIALGAISVYVLIILPLNAFRDKETQLYKTQKMLEERNATLETIDGRTLEILQSHLNDSTASVIYKEILEKPEESDHTISQVYSAIRK